MDRALEKMQMGVRAPAARSLCGRVHCAIIVLAVMQCRPIGSFAQTGTSAADPCTREGQLRGMLNGGYITEVVHHQLGQKSAGAKVVHLENNIRLHLR